MFTTPAATCIISNTEVEVQIQNGYITCMMCNIQYPFVTTVVNLLSTLTNFNFENNNEERSFLPNMKFCPNQLPLLLARVL